MLGPAEPRPLDLVCSSCGTPVIREVSKDLTSPLYCPNIQCKWPYGVPIFYQQYLVLVASLQHE